VEIDTVAYEAELLAEANSGESTRPRDAFAQSASVSAALGE
jgi:hypothetical protein